MRDADNNFVLDAAGRKYSVAIDRYKMKTFTDKEAAIAACPTSAAKCGRKKIFDFRQSKFNRKYNVGEIVLQKPAPGADGLEPDCELDTPENQGTRAQCFLNSDSCTYVVKGGCLAPGFHTRWDNTMTSAEHVDIQVLEWDSKYVDYDQSITTRYNVKQYKGISLGQSELDKYELWPTVDTDWENMDDQSAFKAGQLGNIRQDLTPEEEDPEKKRYQEVPGDWINEMMRRARVEFNVFKEQRAVYQKLRSQYNGALRLGGEGDAVLSAFNWVNAIFPSTY